MTSGTAVGVGEAETHSPTVWGQLTPAQALRAVGGSQECPSSLGGSVLWTGRVVWGDGRVQDGLRDRRQRGRAVVAPGKAAVVGMEWLAVRALISQSWRARASFRGIGPHGMGVGGRRMVVGDVVTSYPGLPGALGTQTYTAPCCQPCLVLRRQQQSRMTEGLCSFLPVQ